MTTPTNKTKKSHWIMDYETMVNCFIGCFEHFNGKTKHEFVVSPFRNDFEALLQFLEFNITKEELHIAYNGLAFDSQITHWILDHKAELRTLPAEKIISSIYAYAQHVINIMREKGFADYPAFKQNIKQVDIFKANHWDNPAKMSSLKWIQYAMDWYNVEEMPIHHSTPITTEEEQNMVLSYCWNDVESTKHIFHLSKEQVLLRKGLSEEYKIDLLSASEPRISKELFAHFLCKKLGIDKKTLRNLRTPRSHIVLADCILPNISFKTPEFQGLLDFMKSKVIVETKDALKYSINYKGVRTDYGLGGLHGAREAGIYEATPGYIIMTSDVISFYPNLAIKNGFHPAHLDKQGFLDLYEWFFEERKKIPKKDPKNYVYKIILNSTYGLSNDKNSFLYDPLMTMQITVNGQLQLSMLYEMLAEGIPGAIPLMQNTDGLEMKIPESYRDRYLEICAEWEKITQLQLEHDEYSKMIIGDVNNYIAINKNGNVKCKGRFEWEDLDKKKVSVLHKNKSFLVIPKAIYHYFVYGTKPEDYLAGNRNIFDYCGGAKAKGDWEFETVDLVKEYPQEYKLYTNNEKRNYVLANGWTTWYSEDNFIKKEWYDNPNISIDRAGLDLDTAFLSTINTESVVKVTPQQRMLRYYISPKGCKIMKVNKKDGRQIQVEAGKWRQTICNQIDPNKPFEEYDLDMDYYISAIYKEIRNIDYESKREFAQLELFS